MYIEDPTKQVQLPSLSLPSWPVKPLPSSSPMAWSPPTPAAVSKKRKMLHNSDDSWNVQLQT